MSKRRRRRPPARSLQAKLRRNMFIIVVFLLLIGWGTTAIVTWPGFHPERVNVRGTARVAPELVRSSAQIKTSTNIWLLNPWKIGSQIEAIPYVATARLERGLPNHVTIAITERHPESCVATARGSVTIDATGRVLEPNCHLPTVYALPKLKPPRVGATITDGQLARMRNDAAIVSTQKIAVGAASFDQDGGLVIVTRDGVTLLLGEDATLTQTAALLGPIFAAVQKQGRHVSQLDLRVASTPVVRYKDSSDSTVKSTPGA